MEIPFGKPIIGEEEKQAVAEVLDGPILVHGPRSKQFESDFATFTGAPHAISVANCTAGLHLIYFHLGLSPGDEVIVPAQTHAATAHAVALTGATPVFVDAEVATGNMDPNQIEAAITPNTKALSIVHFLGLAADMDPIMALARKHDLYVVEDCAIAIGATHNGVHVGLIGDAGTFSFYPVKHMTTAEGGMVITRHEDLAKSLDLKRAFGVDRTIDVRKSPGIYDVTELGFNYRMNEIEAALGIEQLKRMPRFLEVRKKNSQTLRQALTCIPGIRMFDENAPGREPSFYCLSVMLSDELAPKRPQIVSQLKDRGIGTSVYYPRPVPHLSYYRELCGHCDETFPVARRISDHTIALPVGPHLNEIHMAYIAEQLKISLEENL
jgi:dTDP-4-amino-4,6-dideoxygalactose transaminase